MWMIGYVLHLHCSLSMPTDGPVFICQFKNKTLVGFCIIYGGQYTLHRCSRHLSHSTLLHQNQAGSQPFASKLVFLLNSCWISVSVLFLVSGRQLSGEHLVLFFSPDEGNGATYNKGIKWYILVGSGKFRYKCVLWWNLNFSNQMTKRAADRREAAWHIKRRG